MTDYTPNDDFVAHAYAYGMGLGNVPPMPEEKYSEFRAEWERWQAVHDAKVREEFVDLLVEQADLAHFVGADAMVYAVPIFTVESIVAGRVGS